jgi:hypothetical protein
METSELRNDVPWVGEYGKKQCDSRQVQMTKGDVPVQVP